MDLKQIAHVLIRKNYAPNTQKVYMRYLIDFERFCQKELIVLEEGVEAYIKHLIILGHSESAQNQAINAIKFYFEKVLYQFSCKMSYRKRSCFFVLCRCD